MLTLHYHPGNASLTPHMLLEEAGATFDLALVDRSRDAQQSEAYLRLNPNGRIPTLVDGDLVVYETAAICLHLVDRFPDAHLAPAVGTRERTDFYRWVAHLCSTIQPEMRPYFYPEQHVADPAHAPDVKATAEGRILEMFRKVDALLGDGPYLLGQTLSAADHYLFMLTRWTRNMTTPARTLPAIGRHAARIFARPAVTRVFAREGIAEPFY